MPNLPAQTLIIEGPDAIAFAQAQLASDVASLAVGAWQWSAWLNPKGRVRALGHLLRTGEGQLRFVLRGGTATAMAQGLAPYVLRKRVRLTPDAPALLVDAPPRPAGTLEWDDDAITLGLDGYAMRIAHGTSDAAQCWRAHAIARGHAWLPENTLGELLAPSLSLQQLGATDLGKGCFPGQEIVARLHYRGGCKQHLRHIESAAPLVPGSTLRVDGSAAGTILDSVSEAGIARALAVVRDTVAPGPLAVTIDGQSYNICTISDLQ